MRQITLSDKCVCVSPLEEHSERVVLTEGMIVWVHGDAFRDPASECVQINVLLKTNIYHNLCFQVPSR